MAEKRNIINKQAAMQINEVLKRLNNISRNWTSLILGQSNEMDKQALNCAIAYILASYAENAGQLICWERFPKIALYRAFQKVFVYFDTPEHILDEIRAIGEIPKDSFNEATRNIILSKTGDEFGNFICEGLGTYEMRIYRAATKIATYVELTENEVRINNQEYLIKAQQVLKTLEEFSDIPGMNELSNVNGAIFQVLKKISKLRNSKRWRAQSCAISCSVLGHQFETGIFAYLLALEQDQADELLAASMFFTGIWHDMAEVWTTDLPSPIKDKVKNLRVACEMYELKVLDEQLYAKVPDFIERKLKEVSMEEEANQQFKALMKGADYLSADAEIWRQYVSGTRDDYFLGAILRRQPGIESGKVLLTPVCGELHKFYKNTALNVHYDLKLAEFMRGRRGRMTEVDWEEFQKEFDDYIANL